MRRLLVEDLCPCLDAIFGEDAGPEMLPSLAELGFRRFEFWDWRRRDVDVLVESAERLGLSIAAFSGNTFAEPLVDSDGHARALEHLGRSIEVARYLGTALLVAHVGYLAPQIDRERQWDAAVSGLRQAGDLAASAGIRLAVEPLNSRVDHHGYFLDSLDDATRLIDEVDHPAVGLLLDVYHVAMMHDDLLDRTEGVMEKTVHVHLADAPGRGEPGSGTIRWAQVIERLGESYAGLVGLEFWPTTSADAALRQTIELLADGRSQVAAGRIT